MHNAGIFLRFYGTTLGKKVVMALTGSYMLLFIGVHMLGNLQIFLPDREGRAALDLYAELLTASPPVLWGNRLLLLLAVGLHVLSAVLLTWRSWAARPIEYQQTKRVETTLAARTMRWGGVVLAGFIVLHLLHFTVGTLHPDGLAGGFDAGAVRHNVVVGFSSVLVAAGYLVVMVLVGLHASHGAWSLFQTLGLEHPAYNGWRRVFATAFSLLVAGGFMAVPAAVLLQLIQG